MNESSVTEIIPINLEEELKQSYLDYAMSVIVGRALPDARGGQRAKEKLPGPDASPGRESRKGQEVQTVHQAKERKAEVLVHELKLHVVACHQTIVVAYDYQNHRALPLIKLLKLCL